MFCVGNLICDAVWVGLFCLLWILEICCALCFGVVLRSFVCVVIFGVMVVLC